MLQIIDLKDAKNLIGIQILLVDENPFDTNLNVKDIPSEGIIQIPVLCPMSGHINSQALELGLTAIIAKKSDAKFYIIFEGNVSKKLSTLLFKVGKKIGKKTLFVAFKDAVSLKNITSVKDYIGSDFQTSWSIDKLLTERNALYSGKNDSVSEIVVENSFPANKKRDLAGNSLLCVDTYSILHQFYHAVDKEENSDGTPIGLLKAFQKFLAFNILNKRFDYIVFVDEGTNSFRYSLYPEYKSGREADKYRDGSIKVCYDLLKVLNIPVKGHIDFEGDDSVASFAYEFMSRGGDVIIWGKDKDLMQNINSKVHLYNHFKKETVDSAKLKKTFGDIEFSQVRDALAIMGDAADNIPGCPGIGKAGAAKLLKEYGNLDVILQQIEHMPASRTRNLLTENVELIRLSRRLVTTYTHLEEDVCWGDYLFSDVKDMTHVSEFMNALLK